MSNKCFFDVNLSLNGSKLKVSGGFSTDMYFHLRRSLDCFKLVTSREMIQE